MNRRIVGEIYIEEGTRGGLWGGGSIHAPPSSRSSSHFIYLLIINGTPLDGTHTRKKMVRSKYLL